MALIVGKTGQGNGNGGNSRMPPKMGMPEGIMQIPGERREYGARVFVASLGTLRMKTKLAGPNAERYQMENRYGRLEVVFFIDGREVAKKDEREGYRVFATSEPAGLGRVYEEAILLVNGKKLKTIELGESGTIWNGRSGNAYLEANAFDGRGFLEVYFNHKRA
jgi:hypothetical protein